MRFSEILQWLLGHWGSSGGGSTAGGRANDEAGSQYHPQPHERAASRRGLKAALEFSFVLTLSGIGGVGLAQVAPQVAVNGGGDLLIFPYWTVESRDTLLAITNPFGGPNRFVHIRFREGINSDEVGDFTICLSPGDVWTAAITSGGPATSSSFLIVGNPGSCDGDVAGNGFTAPPAPGGEPLALNADFGSVEAYTMECAQPVGEFPPPPLCPIPNGNNDGGDDVLIGTATLVSAASGLASSYNATAWVGFDAFSETASTTNVDGTGTVGGAGNRANINSSLAREGGVDKEILLGRWTASPVSTTQVVLTFPGNAQPGVDDPVNIYIFDEDENSTFSPRQITLDRVVNVCTFMNSADTTTSSTQLSCNDGGSVIEVLGPGGTFTGGWFRIINNNDRTAPDSGCPALNLDCIGDGTGQEFDNINAPPDASFAVLGFVWTTESADLSITKSGPESIILGDPDPLVYTLTVTNNGSARATNVIITDELPQERMISVSGGEARVCGGVMDVEIKDFSPPSLSCVESSDILPFSTMDLEFSTQLDSEEFPAALRQEFEDNGISLSGPFIVTVRVENSEWVITDRGEEGKGYLIRREGNQLNVSGVINCTLDALPAGETAMITYEVTPIGAGIIENTATVTSSAEPEATLGDNRAAVMTMVEPPSQLPQASRKIRAVTDFPPPADPRLAYVLIGSPLALANPDPLAILRPVFGPAREDVWRLFRFAADPTNLPQQGEYQELSAGNDDFNFIPGRGFWFISGSRGTVEVEVEVEVEVPNIPVATGPINIPLEAGPGPRQIATPFNYPDNFSLDWTRCIFPVQEPGVINTPLYGYDFSNDLDAVQISYMMEDTMQPLSGYWIMQDATSAVTLSIPPDCVVSDAALAFLRQSCPATPSAPSIMQASTAAGWRAKLSVSIGATGDIDNYLGVDATSVDGRDQLDAPEPPPIHGLSLSFPHPEWGEAWSSYTSDIRSPSTSPNYVWDFEITTDISHQEVELEWNVAGRDGKTLTLRDVEGNQALNMGQTDVYTYNSGNGGVRRFQVVAE